MFIFLINEMQITGSTGSKLLAFFLLAGGFAGETCGKASIQSEVYYTPRRLRRRTGEVALTCMFHRIKINRNSTTNFTTHYGDQTSNIQQGAKKTSKMYRRGGATFFHLVGSYVIMVYLCIVILNI